MISVNILSQLILDSYQYFLKFYAEDKKFFNQLAQKLATDHIQWLKKLSANRLLYSDCERIYFDKRNKPTETVPSASITQEGCLIDEWIWNIAPLGEASKDFSFSTTVQARKI